MPRTRLVSWKYACDTDSCPATFEVARGDHIETGRGTIIHEQADADAAAKQDGWTVGRHVHCPTHR